MDVHRLQFLVSAFIIFALAGYVLSTYTVSASYQSTFNIQPGLTYDLSARRNPSDALAGRFQENSGNLVSFFILTSAQFAAAQGGTSFNYLYGIGNTSSSVISYTFLAQDTYYLVFGHGRGMLNTTETVFFQRTYTSHDGYRLTLGLILIILGAADLALATLGRKPAPSQVPHLLVLRWCRYSKAPG